MSVKFRNFIVKYEPFAYYYGKCSYDTFNLQAPDYKP